MHGRVVRVRRPLLLTVVLSALLLLLTGSFARAYRAGLEAMATGLLAGRVIFIDPGHGGPDPGSVGGQGTLEKDVVLNIALMLRDYLTDAGALVHMSRTEDVDLSGMDAGPLAERKRRDLLARVDMINNSGADIMVSIHANAIGSPRWSGGQTFYHPESPPASRLLAEAIQRELVHITGQTDRAVNHHIQQIVLRQASMPAVTVEVGFLSNPQEERLLMGRAYQQKVAWAVFVGIGRYFAQVHQPAGEAGGQSR